LGYIPLIVRKTHHTTTEKIIANYKLHYQLLKEGKTNIPSTARNNYYAHLNDPVKCPNNKFNIQMYGYIYNKNKEMAYKTFDRFKRHVQKELDSTMFGGQQHHLHINFDDVKMTLTGEESLRVDAILIKYTFQAFELMLEQTFR